MFEAKTVSQITIDDLSNKIQFLGPDDEVIERVLRGVKSYRILHGHRGGRVEVSNKDEWNKVTLILTEDGHPNADEGELWEFVITINSVVVIIK